MDSAVLLTLMTEYNTSARSARNVVKLGPKLPRYSKLGHNTQVVRFIRGSLDRDVTFHVDNLGAVKVSSMNTHHTAMMVGTFRLTSPMRIATGNYITMSDGDLVSTAADSEKLEKPPGNISTVVAEGDISRTELMKFTKLKRGRLEVGADKSTIKMTSFKDDNTTKRWESSLVNKTGTSCKIQVRYSLILVSDFVKLLPVGFENLTLSLVASTPDGKAPVLRLSSHSQYYNEDVVFYVAPKVDS